MVVGKRPKKEVVKVLLERPQKRKLEDQAKANGRSLTGEGAHIIIKALDGNVLPDKEFQMELRSDMRDMKIAITALTEIVMENTH